MSGCATLLAYPPWGAVPGPSAHICHPDRRPRSLTDLPALFILVGAAPSTQSGVGTPAVSAGAGQGGGAHAAPNISCEDEASHNVY